MIEEIASGVFTATHRVVEGKNGIVFGTRGALAIDSGTDPEEGGAMAAFIRARGLAPDRLAYTHSHGDHALGSAAFRGAEVYAHANTARGIRAQLTRRAERAERGDATVEAMAAEIAWPSVTFSDTLWLDMGGKTVRMFATPGHSDDSACLYLEEDRILFGGDTAVTAITPAFGNGDSRQMEESLRRLATLESEVLVGGHGPVLRGRERIRDHLEWMASYIASSRATVAEVLAGSHGAATQHVDRTALVDAALIVAPHQRLIGAVLDCEQHGMPTRHRATLAKLVDEVFQAQAS